MHRHFVPMLWTSDEIKLLFCSLAVLDVRVDILLHCEAWLCDSKSYLLSNSHVSLDEHVLLKTSREHIRGVFQELPEPNRACLVGVYAFLIWNNLCDLVYQTLEPRFSTPTRT